MAVNYLDLRKQGETIINKATGEAYKDPTQLAVDLGVKADDIEWGKIAEEKVGTPTATGAIKPRDMESETPIETLNKPVDENNYSTAGLFPPEPTELDIEQTRAETEASTISKSITDLLDEGQTKGAYTQQQLETAGVPQLERDVQELTNQLRSLQMESQANAIRIENQSKTTGHISGELRRNERDTAIRTLTISAQLQAKQGNLTLALDQAQRMVDLKYQPIEDKLKILREQYDMNKDTLDRIDKKQSDALSIRLKEWERKLEDDRQRDSDLNAIALKAAEGGAPMSVVSAIQKSDSVIGAIGLATGFLDTDLQLALQKQASEQFEVDRKFEEDVRQFNVQTAIRNRELGISAMNAQTSRINATKTDSGGMDLSGMPSSYKEWVLAGGLEGTNKTYAQWANPDKPTVGTQAQQTVAEYAARIEQSEPTISATEKDIKGMNWVLFNTQLALPSALQSSTVQQYMQASRNFINAKLRRESGAVIAESEFSEARSQYLPQPGDNDSTLKLKKQNRELVFASLKKASGPAFSSVNELLAQETTGGDDYKYTLQANAGGDGYVSPQDWNDLKAIYIQNGGTSPQFDSDYGRFKNPNNPNY